MNSTAKIHLAPPGAGLPLIELFVARILFRLKSIVGTRAFATTKLRLERSKIAALVDACTEESAARRVLIRRPVGLEDSSRNWSVWMTLDHLRIVNQAVAEIIAELAAGRVPPGEASTAAVKPSPSADHTVRAAYEASCDRVLAAAAAVPNLDTAVRYAHPWFGPMNARDWYGLAGVHLGLHRVQIERIRAGC
jgi:hypothetical protein